MRSYPLLIASAFLFGSAPISSSTTLDRLSHPRSAATALVFDHVTVVDVEHGTLLPSQRVVIVGNHIQSMGPAQTVRIPAGATLFDKS